MEKLEVVYRECMKNHSANPGAYSVDGCGEFRFYHITGDYCAACGCAKSWHRKIILKPESHQVPTSYCSKSLEEGSKNKKVLQETRFKEKQRNRGNNRSKLTQFQIEIMKSFAKELGWNLNHKDRQVHITRFCSRIDISRNVFKNWVHNNKKYFSSGSQVDKIDRRANSSLKIS